ncbi:hypothetical protein JCM30237_06930 [Halolamina litorea]|uniref:PKD domain-containing protein n=1 Tax=Halolamina litorea TaxID=1515593 RepID=A0ABD6BR97_9EURY|nr:PKD domain-containing protein [Halolamina litorea]
MKRLPLVLSVLLVTAALPGLGAGVADVDADGRPLADAGLDQSATVGDTVYLDGGGSLDPDGEIVSHEWTIRTPAGDRITPSEPESVTTRFVPDEPGRYHVRLTVTDDDGRTKNDTLYVDVEQSAPVPATPTPSPSPSPTPTQTPTQTAPATTPDGTQPPPTAPVSTPVDPPVPQSDSNESEAASSNLPPSGDVSGPSSVTSGSRVTYTLDTLDRDGNVTDSWWLPTTLATGQASRSDLAGNARTITVDGTPGTTVEVAAIVVDDDGATTTVTKAVDVVNTPPSALIEGDGTAVVNTTKEYRLRATDPDSEITSVSLTSGSGAVEATAQMPWAGPTSSGEWARSFRFTDIPEEDGTVTFEATVRDEFGGVTTVEKSVTVVSSGKTLLQEPTSQSPPEIISIDAYTADEAGLNDGQVRLSATARDADSDKLTFNWQIGDRALLRTADDGDPARGNVSYAFTDMDFDGNGIEVSVTVSDQYGNQRTASTRIELQSTRSNGGVVGRSQPIEITSVQGRTVNGRYQLWNRHSSEEIIINYGDDYTETVTLSDTAEVQFSHRYEFAGRYSISINPGWSPDVSRTIVEVDAQTYEEYSYERKSTTIQRTRAAESPGEDWTRDGIARIEREQTGTETMRTLADGRRAMADLGDEWRHVGTVTEYHTERRTRESTTSPGSAWDLATRNVDEKRVFDGWQRTTIPHRGLLSNRWEYVRAVEKSVDRTVTKRSTDRPSGAGWSREQRVGEVQVGFRTAWVDYRFHADRDWEYRGSKRYVSRYEEETVCVEEIDLRYFTHCVEERTVRQPVYDYRYEYDVPQYDSVYEWERTVQETEYEYRYRAPTYTTEPVHEYERDVRVGTDYAQWERPIYDETDIYRWKKTEETWERSTSFSKPKGDVRNLERSVKECGGSRDADEPPICEGGGQ